MATYATLQLTDRDASWSHAEPDEIVDVRFLDPGRYRVLYSNKEMVDDRPHLDYPYRRLDRRIDCAGAIQMLRRRNPPVDCVFEDAREKFVILKDNVHNTRKLYREKGGGLWLYSFPDHFVQSYRVLDDCVVYFAGNVLHYSNGYIVYSLVNDHLPPLKDVILLKNDLRATFPDGNFLGLPDRHYNHLESAVVFGVEALCLTENGELLQLHSSGEVELKGRDIHQLLNSELMVTNDGQLIFRNKTYPMISTQQAELISVDERESVTFITLLFSRHQDSIEPRQNNPTIFIYQHQPKLMLPRSRPYVSQAMKPLSTNEALRRLEDLAIPHPFPRNDLTTIMFPGMHSMIYLHQLSRSTVPIQPRARLVDLILSAVENKRNISEIVNINAESRVIVDAITYNEEEYGNSDEEYRRESSLDVPEWHV